VADESSFLSEFTFEILIVVVVATGGSVFAYFTNLIKDVKKHKEETNEKMGIIEDRSLRLSTAFLHFVRRNDALHKKLGVTPITLGDEIENLLKDPKTGKL